VFAVRSLKDMIVSPVAKTGPARRAIAQSADSSFTFSPSKLQGGGRDGRALPEPGGSLEVRVGKEEHTLEEGDATYFDASVPHGYRKLGKKLCAAIVVAAP
jgi:hypothetical protein